MKKKFSIHWIKSKQPRKQRKFRKNAPLHMKRKFLTAPLSKDLIKEYGNRRVIVRKGDKVKIMRGQYKKKIGRVEKVNINKERIFVQNAERTRRDGTKSFYPIHASNVMIHELILDDKKRKMSLERKNNGKEPH